MLYPERTPDACVLNTPFKHVVKAFNDITTAIIIEEGSDGAYDVDDGQNKSMWNILRNMQYSRDNANWYLTYWGVVAQMSHWRPHIKKYFDEHVSENSKELLKQWSPHKPFKISSLCAGTGNDFEIDDNPYYNEEYQDVFDRLEKSSDQITMSRAYIISEKPVYEEFILGVPVWYSQNCPIVLQAYDENSRRHIKITNDGQRFHYFTSVISDNFKEIQNIPLEMDKIMAYIISSKGNLALADRGQVNDFL